MQSDYWSIRGAVLEPRPTWRSPSSPLHELCGVFIEVLDSRWGWGNCLYMLGLNFLHHINDILGCMLDDREDGSMPHR